MEKAPEKLKEKCRKNQTSIAYAYKMVKQDERRREQLEVRQNKGNVEVQVFQGDFMEVSAKLQENSIDFIITDPPYGQQFLQLYKKLGEVASRLLKPGGSLLVMAGQSYLPDVFDLLRPYLTYNWTVAYLTPGGQSAQLWERKVNTFWKPVLWFVKGKYEGDWVGDVAKSAPNNNEKQLMEWQQSESGIADLVERFTKPNDLILDPLMGSATTGVVATRLGRRFIGIDIDPKMVEIAKQRMGTVGDVDENNDKTALKMKPKVGPWNGICTEKCWYAEEKKCVCKCEGANHGRGVSKEYGKLDDFNETENESTKALEGRELAAGNLASEAQHGSVV
jgi:predicted RNA methylase